MARPPLLYRVLRALVRGLVRLFFRRVDVEGRWRVPLDRGGLLVAWHPNGIIDPAVILASFPAQVVFGARDGLLRWPVVGAVMRGLGTVPIFRSQDQAALSDAERRAANARSLAALADAVAGGAYSALFPEGVSHDRPGPVEIRHGAARLWALAAEARADGPPPALVPVGLHYQAKSVFRSDVLVRYGVPIDTADAPDAHALTARIADAIEAMSHGVDDWTEHRLLLRAYEVVRAERAARRGDRSGSDPDLSEQVAGVGALWEAARRLGADRPGQVAALQARLEAFDQDLRGLGLDASDLDVPPRIGSPGRVLAVGAAVVLSAVLAPPLILWGLVVNAVPYWALKPLARRFASAEKDEATIKLMGGFVLFPLAWTGASALVAFGVVRIWEPVGLSLAPVAAAFAAGALAAVGGGLVIRAVELAQAAWRNARVHLVRGRLGERLAPLRAERSALYDDLVRAARLPTPQQGSRG